MFISVGRNISLVAIYRNEKPQIPPTKEPSADEGEKIWQQIDEEEEEKLDEELRAKKGETMEDGEPDENVHGEKEDLNASDNSTKEVISRE